MFYRVTFGYSNIIIKLIKSRCVINYKNIYCVGPRLKLITDRSFFLILGDFHLFPDPRSGFRSFGETPSSTSSASVLISIFLKKITQYICKIVEVEYDKYHLYDKP